MGRNKVAHLPRVCGELRDAIGADTIDANAPEGFPLFGVVGGPRDYARVDGVRARNEILVDERHLLPQVLRPGGHERSHRVDVTRVLEHTCPQRREDALHRPDDAVVERVHRAGGFAFANHPDDQRLDARRLDLDVDDGIGANGIEHRGERRDPDIVTEMEFPELSVRQPGDAMPSQTAGIDDGIVVHDDGTVARGVNVEFDTFRSQLDRSQKCGDGILWQGLMRSTVGDLLWRSLSGRAQAFSRVVALGTMSAKL